MLIGHYTINIPEIFPVFTNFSEFDSKIIIVNSPFEILHDYGIYKGDDNFNL